MGGRRKIPRMALTDDELLAIHDKRSASFDHARAARALSEHGDAYRYQLVASQQLELWAERSELTKNSPTTDASWIDGHVRALREVAERLRAGAYLPGGALYDEGVGD